MCTSAQVHTHTGPGPYFEASERKSRRALAPMFVSILGIEFLFLVGLSILLFRASVVHGLDLWLMESLTPTREFRSAMAEALFLFLFARLKRHYQYDLVWTNQAYRLHHSV